MIKFIRLVRNEYIKLMMKASTWVMLAILVISCIGVSVISLIAKNQYESYNMYDTVDLEESYKSEIEYLKEVKTDGWETEIELDQYLLDNKIYNDWRVDAANIMFELKYNAGDYGIQNSEEMVREIDSAISDMDWKSYFRTAIDLYERSEELIDNSGGMIQIYQYCLDNAVAPYDKNWKFGVLSELEGSRAQLKAMEESKASGEAVESSEMEKLSDSVKKYEYRMKNNIDFDVSENNSIIDGNYNFWSVFSSSTAIEIFISVIVIIVAGGIVSGEFSSGTIKFLMINPVKRWKILASKYFTVITFGFLLMAASYVISILSSLIFFGADHIGASYISVSGDNVREISGFVYVAGIYLIKSVNMIVMGSLAFAISSLFRSSALAIGISVMALFGGETITMILSQLQFDWGRYLIFSNVDLYSIAVGDSMFAGQTVLGALIVIAIHMIIFLLTAWDGFTRREV